MSSPKEWESGEFPKNVEIWEITQKHGDLGNSQNTWEFGESPIRWNLGNSPKSWESGEISNVNDIKLRRYRFLPS